MHPSLVVLLLVFAIVSTAWCDIFNGTGDIYITYSNERQTRLRIVYRPELPGLYSPNGYGFSKTAYVDVYQLSQESEASDAYSYLEREKHNRGWTAMHWENYGQYYYTDALPGNVSMTPLIAYGVNIAGYSSDWVYKIYKDEYPIYTVPSLVKPCVHDGQQAYHHEYKCSQALTDKSIANTTARNKTSGYRPADTRSNKGSILAIILTPVALILTSALTLAICCVRQGGCGKIAPAEAPTGGNGERTTNSASNESTDPNLPYTITLRNSLSDVSTIEDPKNSLEPPPSYTSVVTELTTNQLHYSSFYPPNAELQPVEHSSSNQTAFVTNDSPQQNMNNTMSCLEGSQYM